MGEPCTGPAGGHAGVTLRYFRGHAAGRRGQRQQKGTNLFWKRWERILFDPSIHIGADPNRECWLICAPACAIAAACCVGQVRRPGCAAPLPLIVPAAGRRRPSCRRRLPENTARTVLVLRWTPRSPSLRKYWRQIRLPSVVCLIAFWFLPLPLPFYRLDVT